MKLNQLVITIGVWIAFTDAVLAQPEAPTSDDQVVANWEIDAPTLPDATGFELIRWHIQQGALPGKANLHMGRAAALLKRLHTDQKSTQEYKYLLARIEQHQHRFSVALDLLEEVTAIDPRNTEAWLLKSAIHLSQGQEYEAHKSCRAMTGFSEPLVLSTCFLEVAAYSSDLERIYAVLSQINHARSQQADGIGYWMAQILAEQALQLERFDEALNWLEPFDLAEAPLSLVALWADIQLAAGNPQTLLTTLQPIADAHTFVDDALLVRLAIAEVGLQNKHWTRKMASRVEFRIKREDTYHAADLARYFIFVEPDKNRALHWANVNFDQAQLFDDARLLALAKEMQS